MFLTANNFGIISLTITITEPNDSDTLHQEGIDTIRWTNTGYTASVKIVLYKGDTLNKILTSSTSNANHFYKWTVASTQALGADYKIKVTSTSDTLGSDMSDDNFVIAASGAKCSEGDTVIIIKNTNSILLIRIRLPITA